jgi:peptide chain release factor 1
MQGDNKMKRVIEIRAAEGGEDSKLFVSDLATAYSKLGSKLGWTTRLIDVRLGECSLEVEGVDLSGLDNEPGGHRIQRVPPTERKGRVHTSTVTVAVIDRTTEIRSVTIPESDLKIEWYSGTGAGGQYRNKHQNSCRITHIPTGVIAKSECRSRSNSLAEAMAAIQQRVDNQHNQCYNNSIASDRKSQVGTGMRGDKIRTYRFQDDSVQDHITGKRSKVKKVMNGHFDELWS